MPLGPWVWREVRARERRDGAPSTHFGDIVSFLLFFPFIIILLNCTAASFFFFLKENECFITHALS